MSVSNCANLLEKLSNLVLLVQLHVLVFDSRTEDALFQFGVTLGSVFGAGSGFHSVTRQEAGSVVFRVCCWVHLSWVPSLGWEVVEPFVLGRTGQGGLYHR